MNDLIVKINFSALSKGEQTKVYRIVSKAGFGKKISEAEERFIGDMAQRGEKTNPDKLNKAWALLVSNLGIHAGAYINFKLEQSLNDSTPGADIICTLLKTAFSQMIKPLGGSLDPMGFETKGKTNF